MSMDKQDFPLDIHFIYNTHHRTV